MAQPVPADNSRVVTGLPFVIYDPVNRIIQQVDGGEGRGREEDGNESEQRDGGSRGEASDGA